MLLSNCRKIYINLRDDLLLEYPEQGTYINYLSNAYLKSVFSKPEIDLPSWMADLAETVSDSKLSKESKLEWLDAFPSAISDAIMAHDINLT